MRATCINIENLQKDKIIIVDIRLEEEWVASGIVKDSHTITFFDARGNYDAEGFIDKIKLLTPNNEKIAILCHTASRTGQLAPFLQENLGRDVINLEGGIASLIHDGYTTTIYKG